MVNSIIKFQLILNILMIAFCGYAAEEKPVLAIECEVAAKSIYVGQAVPVSVVLISSSPDIEYANPSGILSLKNGKFDYFKRFNSHARAYSKEEKGQKLYYFPLENYIISFDKKGNYEITDRFFDVGVAYPVIINDPFWGRVRSSEVKSFDVPMNKLQIKVKDLPNPPSNFNFSGAVGEFNVETIVPKGDIFVNEEATAYIIVRGKGKIENSAMPQYRAAFSDGLKLKSVSESRNEFLENGELVSEIRLECTFIPERDINLKIGKAKFDYFNPLTGKYSTAESSPVEVKIKSTVSKKDKISI